MEDLSTAPVSPTRQTSDPHVNEDNRDGTKVTPASKYVRDFESLFVPIDVAKLRNKAQNGNLRHCQFRSLCWRYFLNCLPERYDDWLSYCVQNREKYLEISRKHLTTIKPTNLTGENITNQETRLWTNENAQEKSAISTNPNAPPITSEKRSSSRNTSDEDEQEYRKVSKECDHSNIYKTIERDVVRTFPDMEFFRQTEMQEILSNILFNFASENPHLSYKQGMHELLATLLYVAHTDSQTCLINYEGDYANETIATLLNFKYLEHDVFHLFNALMKSIESWYQNDEILIIQDGMTSLSHNSNTAANRRQSDNTRTSVSIMAASKPRQQTVSSVLGLKLKKISENIVRKYDLELFNHLEALQIAPQIYGIRWMRLLFGREFEFLDLLTVWDAIICDRDSMSLVDYVFASMLMTIREQLINGDYTDCLNNLMRHQFKDVPYVIRLALHLRDPINNVRPKSHSQFKHYSHLPDSRLICEPSLRTRQSTSSSLTSKLSQQYLSDRPSLNQSTIDVKESNHIPGSQRFVSTSRSSSTNQQIGGGVDRATGPLFSMTTQDKQRSQLSKASSTISHRLGYLAQQAANQANLAQAAASGSKVGSKFLPNINKIVSSIGQNMQEKAAATSLSSQSSLHRQQQQHRANMSRNQLGPSSATQAKRAPAIRAPTNTQHYRQLPSGDLILSASQRHLPSQYAKEFEMCELQSGSQMSQQTFSPLDKRVPMGQFAAGASLDFSSDSYEDLPSIVDYCWRLLSEQIDSLQRCLPKEKGLHSEDEIFVALAQLKKVRDVLKGSLRLEDELESTTAAATTHTGKGQD